MITSVLHFHCESCGQQLSLQIVNSDEGTYRLTHTYTCREPTIKIMTMNPRRLGVIHGEVDEA